jgi:GxxExxY protein
MLMYEELTREILAAATEVHRQLGPGLLESAYEECLSHELGLRKVGFQHQVPLPVAYKGVKLDCGYRLDACNKSVPSTRPSCSPT